MKATQHVPETQRPFHPGGPAPRPVFAVVSRDADCYPEHRSDNLADSPENRGIRNELEQRLHEFQQRRGDQLQPCTAHQSWVDEQRRVIHNGYGPL